MREWTNYAVALGALALSGALVVLWRLQRRVARMWRETRVANRRCMVFINGCLLATEQYHPPDRGKPPELERLLWRLVPGDLIQIVWGDNSMDSWEVRCTLPLRLPPEFDGWDDITAIRWNNRRCSLKGVPNVR